MQQLLEGPNDFFATFIEVLQDRAGQSIMVDDDVTAGDYLSGFLQGTRTALYENGRESITITLDELSARSIGVLIALFERAVGLYAELIDVNAYNQPGVEAGKKAARTVIDLQRKVLAHLRSKRKDAQTVEEIASAIGEPGAVESVYHIVEHTGANTDHGVAREPGALAFDARYRVSLNNPASTNGVLGSP